MKYAIGILNWIKANEKLSLAIFVLLVAGSVILYKVKGKIVKCEDCTPYQKIAEGLLDALNKAPKETSYDPVQSSYQYAVYFEDTTKPMTKAEWDKYKDSVAAEAKRKLDSLLKKKN